MKLHMQAWKILLKRYAKIWKHVWTNRQLLTFPKRNDLEREFLPAALALEETPTSPLPHIAIGAIGLFILIAFFWSIFGKLDIIVSAGGKVLPSNRVKILQPSETAVVKAIHVQDGQIVKAGQLLLELDRTITDADKTRIKGDRTSTGLAALRATALLKFLDHPDLSRAMQFFPKSYEGISQDDLSEARLFFLAQASEFKSKIDKLDAEISRKKADLEFENQIYKKQLQTLPIVRQRAKEYHTLFDSGYASKHEYLDKEKDKIELENNYVAQKSKIKELEADLSESRNLKNGLFEEARRQAYQDLNENEDKNAGLAQESRKANRRDDLTQMRSPIAGKVQQLKVFTIGGVVTAAQPILTIVPVHDGLEIEAFIQNKDIGFVKENQDATIKIEAFPYTKFGTIPGKIKSISMDAVNDPQKGLLYSTRVSLLKDYLIVEKKKVPLSPGMAVSVEIKTGKRRVIEYFLSPVLTQTNESLKER